MKLAIVVGHTKKSPGTYACAPLRLSEYDYNTQVAQEMYRCAMGRGISAKIFTRDNIGVAGAYKAVNEWGKDSDAVCIELHFNAFNGKARGTETLFDLDPSESIEFARFIHAQMCSIFARKGKDDRGIKKLTELSERGYYNLSECKIPSCIVEPAFGDNVNDADLLMKLQLQYADALVSGVIEYFLDRNKKMSLN